MTNEQPGIQLSEGLLPGVTFIPNGTFISFFVQKGAHKDTVDELFRKLDAVLGEGADKSYDEKALSHESDLSVLRKLKNQVGIIRYVKRTLPARKVLGESHADIAFEIHAAKNSIIVELLKNGQLQPQVPTSSGLACLVSHPAVRRDKSVSDEESADITITVTGGVYKGKSLISTLISRFLNDALGVDVSLTRVYENEQHPPHWATMPVAELLGVVKAAMADKKLLVVDGPSTPKMRKQDSLLEIPSFKPSPMIAVLVKCPEWFTEAQRDGFKNLIETMPTVISGLESGIGSTARMYSELGTEASVNVNVRENQNMSVRNLIESILIDAFNGGVEEIGPFEIAFIEPDSTATKIVDGWSSEKWYLLAPYCKRAAGRDNSGIVPPPGHVEYSFRFWTDDLRYGPAVRNRLKSVFDTAMGNLKVV